MDTHPLPQSQHWGHSVQHGVLWRVGAVEGEDLVVSSLRRNGPGGHAASGSLGSFLGLPSGDAAGYLAGDADGIVCGPRPPEMVLWVCPRRPPHLACVSGLESSGGLDRVGCRKASAQGCQVLKLYRSAAVVIVQLRHPVQTTPAFTLCPWVVSA